MTNQIMIALITYCLLMLLKQETGFNGSLTRIKRLLVICSFETFEDFVSKLLKKPKQRRTDHEDEFKLVERMVMTGHDDCFYNQSCDDMYV